MLETVPRFSRRLFGCQESADFSPLAAQSLIDTLDGSGTGEPSGGAQGTRSSGQVRAPRCAAAAAGLQLLWVPDSGRRCGSDRAERLGCATPGSSLAIGPAGWPKAPPGGAPGSLLLRVPRGRIQPRPARGQGDTPRAPRPGTMRPTVPPPGPGAAQSAR